jgi:hypothetical protein
MASLDMSDAFDVFQTPEHGLPTGSHTPSKLQADAVKSAEDIVKSAEDVLKAGGLTVTMSHFTHSCAASLFAPLAPLTSDFATTLVL